VQFEKGAEDFMASTTKPIRVVIMGAAGRDFHNFNVAFRDNPSFNIMAFTAAQIPGIAGRRYPAALAGKLYPDGIPILDEDDLATICRDNAVDQVIFAYSDVEHATVMHKASITLAAGADFSLLGPQRTMLKSKLPVIAICAVRTGVGKSQTTRWLGRNLRAAGIKAAIVRHPMPYGDLEKQAVQRFATLADLDAAKCTIEEREEYEPHIAAGNVVFAGVDYERILRRAEEEAQIVLWDGGNNDFSFYKPDLHIVMVDPLRPGHETTHHPGEAVLRMADIVVVAKTNSASSADVQKVIDNARHLNPTAQISRAASLVTLDDEAAVRGKRVLVVDDGPTITHGGMAYGAGYVAATQAHAAEIVDARRSAAGDIADVYRKYSHIGKVLPAMGYSPRELADLETTINEAEADVVVAGTPIDLAKLMTLNKPVIRARYEFAEAEGPSLATQIDTFLRRHKLVSGTSRRAFAA
jgi:predicted GTPase